MPRLLKPIDIADNKKLIRIFSDSLKKETEWLILDQELGSIERGTIDLFSVNPEKRPHLITISHLGIEDGIIRSIKGYRWFRENQSILKRLFSDKDIDFTLPVRLVLFISNPQQDALKIVKEICSIPIILYRYICFGPEDDPSIFIELFEPQDTSPNKEKTATREEKVPQSSSINLNEIKTRLKIELADLDEKEIEEFLNLDLP